MVKFKLRVRPTRDGAEGVHRTTVYRRRIKEENPLEHSIVKAKDSLRKRQERQKLKSDQLREGRIKKKHELEMQAIRQRKYRERKKIEKQQKELQQKAAEQETTEIESNVDLDDGTRR